MELYPLSFTPISKYRIWGGNKLNNLLQKEFKEKNIGESWEISGVENDETVVNNGHLKGKTLREIATLYKDDFLGKNVYEKFEVEFPLLIKFIDAKTPLSVQVHPSNEIARKRHNSFGKNEMWYIMDADEDAEIIIGFNTSLSKTTYSEYLKSGKVLEVLNKLKVKPSDAFNIPTGRVHAIGAGVLLAEIQQTSDVTYRIYDYDRIDKKSGEKRELHNDLAIDVLDFNREQNYKTSFDSQLNTSNKLIHTPYFKTNLIIINDEVDVDCSTKDSFMIYMCVKGTAQIIHNDMIYELKLGSTILIPAQIKKLKIRSEAAELLEVYY